MAELSVAFHHVFNSLEDIFKYDVCHQVYMAYAAVISLLKILRPLLHDSTNDQTSKPLIKSLFDKLWWVQFSLDRIFPAPKIAWIATSDLETKIRDTVYKAQDTVETLLISCHSLSSPASLVFLQETIAEVDSLTKTSEEIKVSIKEYREREGDLLESENALPSVFRRDDIVGQDKNLKMLKDVLLANNRNLQVVPIVGMVGIGKTALAKCIYDDPHVRESFTYRAWVTVSTEYRVGDILFSLMCDTLTKIERDTISYEYLPVMLLGKLYNKKYLLVIDDLWNCDVWYQLIDTFPDNKNGSRVILTTTDANLASNACSRKYMLRDPFLDDDDSWNLLRNVVFTNDLTSCPSGPLEIIGRKIAKSCEGLPLAIIEIGKILRGTEKTVEKWKEVEESENPLVVGGDVNTPLSKALYWSYKKLPPYLKACFLYMGMLPRNAGIRTSKLIKLWVTEGFLEQAKRKNIEEKAEACLDELVSQSIVLVRKHSSSGRTKICDGIIQGTINRVLDLLTLRFYEFPNQVLGLARLRYLAITYDNELPPSISRLFYLEVLIVRRHHIIMSSDHPVNYLPIEIWDLHRLRHLHCMGYDLPDPFMIDRSVFLEDLLTLSGVSARSCVEGVLERMPNLTKVGIRMVQSPHNDTVENFGFFSNFGSLNDSLDSFKCVVVNPVFGTHDFVSSNISPSFSINIRKITLSGCGFPWDYMSVIGELPSLEVLKLRLHAFRGNVCDLSGAEFVMLRFLLLEDLDVECWKADWPDCFPALEHLIIRHCYKLQDIDPTLVEVLTLEVLEVDSCSIDTEDWAREMEKRKNDVDFRVQIHSSRDGNNKKA
ncbi:hypothetical protein CASFOL_027956 [Castilleja foliolosa]|uniref:NB-ARC domain-containing protein n=1 Tax=Castilleja foliolosa TaxID=1961234 RepID=A0ABD3CGA3_9LAMI